MNPLCDTFDEQLAAECGAARPWSASLEAHLARRVAVVEQFLPLGDADDGRRRQVEALEGVEGRAELAALRDKLAAVEADPPLAKRAAAHPEINTAVLGETAKLHAGDEENRRVDMISDNDELFKPVVHERFSEFDINPPALTLTLGADAR